MCWLSFLSLNFENYLVLVYIFISINIIMCIFKYEIMGIKIFIKSCIYLLNNVLLFL